MGIAGSDAMVYIVLISNAKVAITGKSEGRNKNLAFCFTFSLI